jgi:hypothetical protein
MREMLCVFCALDLIRNGSFMTTPRGWRYVAPENHSPKRFLI